MKQPLGLSLRFPVSGVAGLMAMAIALAVSSCGGTDVESADLASGDVAINSETAGSGDGEAEADTTVDGVATDTSDDGTTPDGQPDETKVAEALVAYDEFLAVRDAAYMNPDGDLSALEAIAGPDVVDEVTGFWARNEAFQTVDAGILERSSTSNVYEAFVAGSGVIIRDCVEMRQTNQDELGSPVRFIEQDVNVDPEESGWVVSTIAVLRSGDPAGTDWFGCVPQYHADRVSNTVAQLGDALYEWQSSEDAAVPEDLFSSFSERLRAEGEAAVEQQNAESGGRYLSSVEERRVTVAGSDVGTGGWNFLVELCRHYPNGEVWTDQASDVEVELRPVGSSTRIGYRVLSVEQADGSWVDEIVDLTPVEYPSPCWEEGSS